MNLPRKVFRKIFPTTHDLRVKKWFAVNGDKTLRVDYDLNEDSIVFDMGGYEGQWASDIYSRSNCQVIIFEPFPEFAAGIRKRFAKNNRIKVFEFGLGDKDEKIKLFSNNDGTSAFAQEGTSVEIEIRKASPFIQSLGIPRIDLMKINIEGGEYSLIADLIKENTISRIDNLQVQFHDFVDGAKEKMTALQKDLARTHQLTYQYEFVWENWSRIK
jgi:FkbM family methyltransferase